MPTLNCVVSSDRHLYGILSVGVLLLGVQHVRPEVILLLQYQSFPIQPSIAKFQFGIDNMLLVFIKLICCCRSLGHTALNSLLQYVNWLVWEVCSVN